MKNDRQLIASSIFILSFISVIWADNLKQLTKKKNRLPNRYLCLKIIATNQCQSVAIIETVPKFSSFSDQYHAESVPFLLLAASGIPGKKFHPHRRLDLRYGNVNKLIRLRLVVAVLFVRLSTQKAMVSSSSAVHS